MMQREKDLRTLCKTDRKKKGTANEYHTVIFYVFAFVHNEKYIGIL